MLVPAGNGLNLIYFVASFSVPTQFIVKGYMKTRRIYTSLERWSDLFGKPVGVKISHLTRTLVCLMNFLANYYLNRK